MNYVQSALKAWAHKTNILSKEKGNNAYGHKWDVVCDSSLWTTGQSTDQIYRNYSDRIGRSVELLNHKYCN